MFNSIRRFLTARKLRTYGAELKQAVNHPIQAEAPDLSAVKAAGYLGPPHPFQRGGEACNKCGGYFVPAFLTPAYQGTVLLFEDGNVGLPHFESVYYCQGCAPRGPIRLTLRLASGDAIGDDIIFRIEDGYFQQVDENTGEDQYVVSIEEYAHTFCEECGELIEETQCRRHRPSPQPEPGPDAPKKRGRKR